MRAWWLAVGLSACASIDWARVQKVKPSQSPPPEECQALGDVLATDFDPDDALLEVRDQAGQLGGNYVWLDPKGPREEIESSFHASGGKFGGFSVSSTTKWVWAGRAYACPL
jgi:hypothetical protein